MAKLLCVSWVPRSHIHLYETYMGLGKITLNLSEVRFEDDLSFKITGYGRYPEIYFTQEWSGMHYFVAEVPNEGVYERAVQFIRDMQELLMNEIFKKCHTVTFKQISSDIMPLDFHVVILSKERLSKRENFVERSVGDITVAFDPREIYSPGTLSSVVGVEDLSLKNVILYHAYVEVAADFLMNMMRRMTRLYHEAGSTIASVESSEDLKSLRKAMDDMDTIAGECSQSFGKILHARENFKLKFAEYKDGKLSRSERELAEAFGVEQSLRKINADADYMHILWKDVLIEYLEDIDATLDARVMYYSLQKKRGLFG
ncbi:MAG: hypothetical protein FJY77_04285 [Candidatus Altiarchaeales archaeon]|nr:hypothetical protein [Candidatus Altiarchaeales archaeon]